MSRPEQEPLSPLETIEILTGLLQRHSNRAESTVVRWASGSGDTLKRLRDGHRITTDRVDAIVAWFSINWPANLDWPDKIHRPASNSQGYQK